MNFITTRNLWVEKYECKNNLFLVYVKIERRIVGSIGFRNARPNSVTFDPSRKRGEGKEQRKIWRMCAEYEMVFGKSLRRS